MYTERERKQKNIEQRYSYPKTWEYQEPLCKTWESDEWQNNEIVWKKGEKKWKM